MAKFFHPDDEARIVAAIKAAETATSGEIRIHVTKRCPGDPVTAARTIFNNLHMDQTAARNGVLFFIATDAHKFAVIGDQGINEVTPDNFWEDIVEAAMAKFKEGAYTDGLERAITMAGEALQEFFPYQDDDENELSDEIHYDA
jgi:uncharacterized membrane protein